MTHTRVLPGERAEHHAEEAERLLHAPWLTSHVKAQAHATLAVYYATLRANDATRTDD